MNRRGMRVREYYGYALIAGIGRKDAENMTPGWVLDMFMIRMRYDAKLAGAQLARKMTGG